MSELYPFLRIVGLAFLTSAAVQTLWFIHTVATVDGQVLVDWEVSAYQTLTRAGLFVVFYLVLLGVGVVG